MLNLNRLKTHWKIWTIVAKNALMETFIDRGANSLFLLGKVVRLVYMLLFLLLIQHQVNSFAGYSSNQVIVFFLVYNFLDTLAQVFYRGVYEFSYQIKTGRLDSLLAQPVSPLFRILTGKPDINDVIFLLPTTAISIWIVAGLGLNITASSFFVFLALLMNAFLVATALHILVLAIGIVTTEVEGAIWLYRDLIMLGRFPITIYLDPLRWLLFFLVPIGFMVTIPAQVLMNLTPTYTIGLTFACGLGFLFASLKIWKFALKKYTSASS